MSISAVKINYLILIKNHYDLLVMKITINLYVFMYLIMRFVWHKISIKTLIMIT